jgi:hypothetical protein
MLMDELLHFPESFPLSALSIVAPIVRTGKVENPLEAGEAAWNLGGWAMAQYLGHDHMPNVVGASRQVGPKAKAPDFTVPSKAAAVKSLKAIEAQVGDDPESDDVARAARAIDWSKFAGNALKIFQFVLPLILAQQDSK